MAMKIISPLEFDAWVRSSKRGDRLTYYVGFLCHDRSHERDVGNTGIKVRVVNKELDTLASAIWEAYENRRVIPVQTKLGLNAYMYTAVRT